MGRDIRRHARLTMAKRPLSDAPEVAIGSIAELRTWLSTHHAQDSGVWVVSYKKADPDRYVAASEIVDQCLCFGWVDSLPRAKDDQRTMLYISPRKASGNWSRVNKNKVARLIEQGLMTPSGLAVVAKAKTDGTWTALDDVENLIIPEDLQAAFAATPKAMTNWEGFPRSVKRGALEILLNAKRSATRQTRIETIVSDSAANRRPFQWRKP